jgi:hypothetical protein
MYFALGWVSNPAAGKFCQIPNFGFFDLVCRSKMGRSRSNFKLCIHVIVPFFYLFKLTTEFKNRLNNIPWAFYCGLRLLLRLLLQTV